MELHPLIFSGSSNLPLAHEISNLVNIPLGQIKIENFPDSEISIQLLESVQNRNVYVIQSLFPNINQHLIELLLIIDALKRASAKQITIILPYYGYARQDRLDKSGVPISAKVVANLLKISGIHRLITLDLHSEQIEGFFDIPVEHLLSRSLLIPYCRTHQFDNPIVIAPDKGGIKIAVNYAKALGFPVGLIEKERINPYQVNIQFFVGDVKDRTVILPDDMCSTGSTLIQAAEACKKLGAKRIVAIVGHGLFINDAIEKIEKSPIETMITTNSIIQNSQVTSNKKITVLSVASLFSDIILSDLSNHKI
ncbi:MAG: ribose-phosphate diphosphokinase [Parachlamydiaceae bacterium]|nr:ribose-phosphate diphosphokinase [Parachlamydiaceae bacterium]